LTLPRKRSITDCQQIQPPDPIKSRVSNQEIVDSIDVLSTEEQTKLFEFICQRQRQVELGDETDYLLSSLANEEHLQRSIDQLRQGKVLEHKLIDG
jgi:hypothetical protein